MIRPRLLFYIQHLLGIGHLVRGSRIATALAEAAFDVTVVVGGELPDGLDFGRARLRRLPAVKAGPGGFADLVTPDGQPFDATMRAGRRDLLIAIAADLRPDVLLIEAFPFGRRQMRFELLPLLDLAQAMTPAPLIVSSVRDILQENRKASRDAEVVDLVRSRFDLVVVHGDAALARLDDSFPRVADIADRTVYGGLVCPPEDHATATGETFDVVVSVGGGAVGAGLIAMALAARPLSRMAEASWLVLTGPNLPAPVVAPADPNVTVRGFAPDLPARLRRAHLSISQAGYNTVTDLLKAPTCRAVLVPHAENGETEQARRAQLMHARGLAVAVDAARLDPQALAAAMDRALDLPARETPFALDGAGRTRDLILAALAAKQRQLA